MFVGSAPVYSSTYTYDTCVVVDVVDVGVVAVVARDAVSFRMKLLDAVLAVTGTPRSLSRKQKVVSGPNSTKASPRHVG